MTESRPRFAERLAVALGALGLGAFVWPSIIGIGLGTGVYGLIEPRFARGLLKRRASADFRHPVAVAIVVAIVAVVLASLLFAFLSRRRGDRRSLAELYNLGLRRLALLTALPLGVALAQPIEASHAWVTLAFAGTAALLSAYSAYFWSNGKDSDARARGIVRFLAPAVAFVLALAYVVAVSELAIANHLSFNTGRADIGFYMSIFRQSSQGIPLGCSLCGGTHLTGHFDPLLILFSPLYLIYPWAETLLVIQAVWLAVGAFPVYLLASHHVKHRGVALSLVVAYLAYPALHGVNLFDFHSLSLAGPLLLWLLYFVETRKIRAYYVTLPFLLLVREDISLVLVLVAIHLLFSKDPKLVRTGLVTIAVSVVYFLIAKRVFMGHLDPLNSDATSRGYAGNFADVIPAGQATGGLVGTVLTDPVYTLMHVLTEAKLVYVFQLGVPLLFLPLLAKERLLLAYGGAFTLLSTAPFLHSIHFQYSTLLIPFVFALTASALGRIARFGDGMRGVRGVQRLGLEPKRLAHALAFGVLVSTLLCSWKFGAFIPNGSFEAGFYPLRRTPSKESVALDAWLRDFARKLPRGAKVAANSHIIPHLGIVTSVFLVEQRHEADYVIANVGNRQVARMVKPEIASHELVLVASKDGVQIFKTNYGRAKAPAPHRP